MAETIINFEPDGSIRGLPADEAGAQLLQALRCPAPKRASHVEPIPNSYPWRWFVDMSPLGEAYQFCLWPACSSREEALEAEHAWLVRYWLGP